MLLVMCAPVNLVLFDCWSIISDATVCCPALVEGSYWCCGIDTFIASNVPQFLLKLEMLMSFIQLLPRQTAGLSLKWVKISI